MKTKRFGILILTGILTMSLMMLLTGCSGGTSGSSASSSASASSSSAGSSASASSSSSSSAGSNSASTGSASSVQSGNAENSIHNKFDVPIPLFEFLGDGMVPLKFAEDFYRDGALSLTVSYDTEASGEPYTTEDEETILAVFQILENMYIVSDEGSGHTDDYLVYYFVMHDGTSMLFQFQQGDFLTDRMDRLGITGYAELVAALPPLSPDFHP